MQHARGTPGSSSVDLPYVPFQFNATLASPLFNVFPIASNDRLGWAPSCFSPDCLPTASWSTRLVNSTLDFSYWGWGITFDGRVEGNMTVQLIRDGQQERWIPSDGTLFTVRDSPLDYTHPHAITLKVIDASPDARLTVTQTRVNGSSLGAKHLKHFRWTLPSDHKAIQYSGFAQRPSLARLGSPTTYVSTAAGDKVNLQWNGSAVLLYGPCGPSNGLVRIKIDQYERTLNLSKPFESNDCLLFQSRGMSMSAYHQLQIENLDGGFFALDRMEFRHSALYLPPGSVGMIGEAIIIVLGVIVLAMGVVIGYTTMTRRAPKKGFGGILSDEYLVPLLRQ